MSKLIPLTKGQVARVDDEDFERLSIHKWSFQSSGYAVRHTQKAHVYMHRDILGATPGIQADHINGDRLDNRRANLRAANAMQQQGNRRLAPDNKTGYRGVQLRTGKSPWIAQIGHNYRMHHLGRFETAEEAAAAYDTAARLYFGEFARTNADCRERMTASLVRQDDEVSDESP